MSDVPKIILEVETEQRAVYVLTTAWKSSFSDKKKTPKP